MCAYVSWLPASLEDALIDEVGLGAFNSGEDVVDFLSGAEAVVVYALALAPCSLSRAAPSGLLTATLNFLDFCVKFHNVKNFDE